MSKDYGKKYSVHDIYLRRCSDVYLNRLRWTGILSVTYEGGEKMYKWDDKKNELVLVKSLDQKEKK